MDDACQRNVQFAQGHPAAVEPRRAADDPQLAAALRPPERRRRNFFARLNGAMAREWRRK
jgi:hypothetical protein